ncbi:MAG: CCA tRNA nucleotidyltransferase [Hyphomicrobiales bacterium]
MGSVAPSLAGWEWLRDKRLQSVMRALADAGGTARAVGGCVRDALLDADVAPEDVDIATNLLPEQVMEAGEKAGLGVHPTGLQHGTIMLTAGDESNRTGYEVTTLRIDVETDGRHAEVAFTQDWVEDAMRRDFTMNALYCDADGAVFDPISGYADLIAKRVVFVGDAEQRIREDYLRILRFYRFLARFGVENVDTASREACGALRLGLDDLSRERIAHEFSRLLAARFAYETLKLMRDDGILGHVLDRDPELDAFANLKSVITENGLQSERVLLMSILFPSASVNQLRKAFVLTNEETKRLEKLNAAGPVAPGLRNEEIDRLIYWAGDQTFYDVLLVRWAQSGASGNDESWRRLLARWCEWKRPSLPVTGADLIDLGIEQGPALGKALQTLEDWWIAGGFKDNKEALLKRLEK